MGERPAPYGVPPLMSPPPAPGNAGPALAAMHWPPKGWPMFSCITHDRGMAAVSAHASAECDYLQYEVAGHDDGTYSIQILAGCVRPEGASLAPVIGLRFQSAEDFFDGNSDQTVIDMHVRGQRLIPERGAVLRVILAATFIISRIDRGIAPSAKRVLKMYRLI